MNVMIDVEGLNQKEHPLETNPSMELSFDSLGSWCQVDQEETVVTPK